MHALYVGADHRGFALKQSLLSWLQTLPDWTTTDSGNTVYDPDDDFTKYAFAVAEAVRDTPSSRGMLICHSAVGMCIAANKVQGVRAGQATSVEQVIEDRQHNNFQVLCLPSEITLDEAKELVLAFLQTEFSGKDRYARRIAQIAEYEAQQ